jgi:dodecin
MLATLRAATACTRENRRKFMAKKASAGDGVYRVTEVIGTSKVSWEEAAKHAVELASHSLRDLRIAEVTKLDMRLDDKGKVVAYRARVSLSFKYAP